MTTATFELEAVGHVQAARSTPVDDQWGGSTATIVLAEHMQASTLDGIEEFSHVEIVYVFDRVAPERIVRDARHPRNNPAWPKVGIFAQRGKNRPNRLGCSIVRVIRREPRALIVAELDAIDGSPVLDIKPVMREFLPREQVRQPAWSTELMRDYWIAAT